MKIHYINILLFELPLNILIYNQRNHKSTIPLNTPKIPITRLLCECDIYTSIYDNDPQMKAVMENYNRQTSDRFKEYDERMKTTRQKCKDRCDNEIQKIILKDKLEKELMDKFATLHTDIQNDAIPTCVCEKSVADKVEKACLKCGGVLGGGVTPAWGLLSGIVYTGWKAAALATAKELAEKAGAAEGSAKGAAAGATRLIELIQSTFQVQNIAGQSFESVFTAQTYTDVTLISGFIETEYYRSGCGNINSPSFWNKPICNFVNNGIVTPLTGKGGSANEFIETTVETMMSEVKGVAARVTKTATDEATATFTTEKTGVVQSTYMSYQTPIIASVVAILIIVLVMIIIYLFLRYRRKKKMKKKLQYIKLLEE
ncbi:rifin [Plasmodium falciparum IGH-CR14]|uniref:Rifin n=1 Tax=Plasmodium falciparum IGH-CR14 TaxID=580059 RepID=A0A0L1I8H7_PLAFA|nr:rifin [Plasmodium falciparum IGH-CR14]